MLKHLRAPGAFFTCISHTDTLSTTTIGVAFVNRVYKPLEFKKTVRCRYGAAGDRGTVSTKTTYPYEVSSSSIRDLNSTGAYSPSFSSPQDPLERTRARFRNDNRGEQTPSRGPAWKGEHHPPAGAIAVASSPQFDPRSGAAGCNGSNHANNSQLISSTLHGPKRVVHQREQKHTPMHHTTRGTGVRTCLHCSSALRSFSCHGLVPVLIVKVCIGSGPQRTSHESGQKVKSCQSRSASPQP